MTNKVQKSVELQKMCGILKQYIIKFFNTINKNHKTTLISKNLVTNCKIKILYYVEKFKSNTNKKS